MTDKHIVEYNSVAVEEVNDYLKQGWQPHGSPFVVGGRALQAMVKYGQPPMQRPSPQVLTEGRAK